MNKRAILATATTVAAVVIICYFPILLTIVLGLAMCSMVLFLVSWLLAMLYEGYRDYFEERDNRTKDNKCAEEEK